jgi:hypothetical protein
MRTCVRMSSDDDDRPILAALAAAYPAMLDLATLRQLEGVERLEEALRRLAEDGLAVRVGDMVGTSRTYRRAQALLRS